MFQEALDAYLKQQKARLVSVCGPEKVQEAFQELKRCKYDPDSINEKCARELCLILNKRYEAPIKSTRLDGHGWSTSHVQHHMQRFLQHQLKQAGSIMKAALQDEPLEPFLVDTDGASTFTDATHTEPDMDRLLIREFEKANEMDAFE
jgi:hypothetical protein